MSKPRVLAIAGSDPGGGAGIQADLKSIMAAGGYGMAAITSLTAQNTRGVYGIHTPPPEFIRAQLEAISADITVDAIKIGMIGSASIARDVARWIRSLPNAPVVVLDPVMVSTSGSVLGQGSDFPELLACATVLTPNIPELAVLCGSAAASTYEEALAQAQTLASRCRVPVVLKCAHLDADDAGNTWVTAAGPQYRAASARVATRSTHGTGCSLSSALATRLVTASAEAALRWATDWLHGAIVAGEALEVGSRRQGKAVGHGPVDHGWRIPGQ